MFLELSLWAIGSPNLWLLVVDVLDSVWSLIVGIRVLLISVPFSDNLMIVVLFSRSLTMLTVSSPIDGLTT